MESVQRYLIIFIIVLTSVPHGSATQQVDPEGQPAKLAAEAPQDGARASGKQVVESSISWNQYQYRDT